MINKYNNQIINDLVLARMLNLQRIDTHLLIYLFILIYNCDIMINCKYNNQIINDLVLGRMLNLQRIDTHILIYLFLVTSIKSQIAEIYTPLPFTEQNVLSYLSNFNSFTNNLFLL